MSNLKQSVYALLERVKEGENITRPALGQISRELLLYVPESQDIEAVNRLIGVLTPMNRRAAILYFSHFLPWEVEKDNDGNFVRFGKKFEGEKKTKRRMSLIDEWLKDEANNFWTWTDVNIQIKQKDFPAMIARTIKKALEGDVKSDTPALNKVQIMQAVMEGGVGLVELLEFVEHMKKIEAEYEEMLTHNDTEAQAA